MSNDPAATYRLQLHPGFGFAPATDLIDYFEALGVSHVYTSPYLQAAQDSMHGYDVVDPTRVNRQLGGAEAHATFCQNLRRAGLQHLIDIVPNHMAIAGAQNPWWWDVLENGPSSLYATYFDVDWETSEDRWKNKVLLPVLGDHYGRILEAGQLQLSHDQAHFALHYYDHVFPLDPSSLSGLLGRAAEASDSETLAFLAESYARMPRPTVTAKQAVNRRHRDKAVLFQMLARICAEEPHTLAAINDVVATLNRNIEALDDLLEQQNYRLAYWRTASNDLGYRRFFDISDLAGLRIESPEVFADTHALPIQWVKKGWVQGLRIDHPDGLRNPSEYLQRLREHCPNAWIVVEKILEPGETLRDSWPIAGTTGYEFLNCLGGLFVNPASKTKMQAIYEGFVGEQPLYEEQLLSCKEQILDQSLTSELNRLTTLFIAVCEQHRRYRDYTRDELFQALSATAARFPVYRSYVVPGDKIHPDDAHHINLAIAEVEQQRSDLDGELLQFLHDLLLLKVPGELENELAMRFQQLTGPAMAKGLEDTHFYRFNRLVCLNEVGGDPSQFGVDLEDFHALCRFNQEHHPSTLLASTTHDTKRSEDVRARLAVLSEIPQQWQQMVEHWRETNVRHRDHNDWPDGNTEYLIYQTLVGAWPIDRDRLSQYLTKAMREAKQNTAWTQINDDYEQAVQAFAEALLRDSQFIASLEGFVNQLRYPGQINSLAQTLVKLTAPGVPDIYQGTELWDFSLVDPDNRRPVDYALRRRLLGQMREMTLADVLAQMDAGLPKLYLIKHTLYLRRQHPSWFGPQAQYQAVAAEGQWHDHVLAFTRGAGVMTVVPRWTTLVQNDWRDTCVPLPEGQWHNVLTGEDIYANPAPVQSLWSHFPVALLMRKDLI